MGEEGEGETRIGSACVRACTEGMGVVHGVVDCDALWKAETDRTCVVMMMMIYERIVTFGVILKR